MTGALTGIQVLDLSRILAGPWATQLLGDFGATIIKVEKPGEGDDTRRWGPPFVGGADAAEDGTAAYFLAANRNKRSIAVDFTTAEGQALLIDLAARSDVVVENYKVGGLAKYGLDYPSLRAVNPRLIYCSISGFGQDGPYAHRLGYDFLVQGMSGLMSVTGTAEGGPQKAGVALADIITGLYAGNAILAALHHREKTGEGQHIDVALLDCMVAAMANQALNHLASGRDPQPLGNGHPSIVPYDTFPTGDGHINLAVGNDGQFTRLCAVLAVPELSADPRFATNSQRVTNRAALTELLTERLTTAPSAHWLALLEAAAVPAGPINTLGQVFADPQVKHRGLALTLPHPVLGPVPGVACPVKLSGTPITDGQAPPALGADTATVLRDVLGLDQTRLAALAAAGVIGAPSGYSAGDGARNT
ncbi:CaiB/BaiF CoA transferase family protein [Nitrospirillum pindoramense]|uniref:Crotonobetainyl-CoA:carnitine CoA-transferase CaiB-like acyl-CoA transferase n=1 Tax=Nitrospirillum amazonense TaxID=28077 RepID=A0A560H573_9PROT|nr:CaiB/BaiF CoA-transferase family protein [Nitrospirillum amazonense]TWB40979.1 crotonobetainyl-CoA:carnitine CoA-transferase CaiB-like acyl-CoA transferase [Nitrospirillum amazonense]